MRQVTEEGWPPEHDDKHDQGELAQAAACYAFHASSRFAWAEDEYRKAPPPFHDFDAGTVTWPWDMKWWKPKSPWEDLVRAGGLILAEMDRLERMRVKAEGGAA